jgi:leucyl aminopeptidase
MFGNITEIPQGSPEAHLAPHELLIALSLPGMPMDPWVQEIEKKASAFLSVNHHYFRIKSGFFAVDGSKPWVSLSWENGDKTSLERRWLANRLTSWLKERGPQKSLVFWLPKNFTAEQLVVIEDLLMGYMGPRYQESKLESVRILTENAQRLDLVDGGRNHRLQSHLGFRKWVNENPDELTSIEMGLRLKDFADKHKCDFHSMDVAELKKNKMNLLLTVGQASEVSPPRLHLVSKIAKGDKRPPLLLIGKGVTFDTGGINLKPHESFVNCMKNDMGGAGLMSMVFQGLVACDFSYPIVLAIPCCENSIGEKAMKPGSIIESASGKTVIIEHTDAEGRLILADAITYCHKKYNPKQTVVAATLTTASMRQFSGFITAVHFADRQFVNGLEKASGEWGERFTFWDDFLPFREGNMSNAADLTNMGRLPNATNGAAGSNVAAHFLREFAVNPLIHMDIFASTWNWGGQYPGANYGATGAPFNSLFNFLKNDGVAWLAGG